MSDVTREPGASTFLTQGFGASPRSTAFFARMPAPTIIAGSVAVVQLVMAAIAMAPWPRLTLFSPSATSKRAAGSFTPCAASPFEKRSGRPAGVTRSCGRDGPARLGSTVARSSVTSRAYVRPRVWPKTPCIPR